MSLDELTNGVPPGWRPDFAKLIEGDEVSDEFLSFLDTDKATQDAVEKAFEAQAGVLEILSQALKSDRKALSTAAPSHEPIPPHLEVVASQLAEALAETQDLSPELYSELFQLTTALLVKRGLAREGDRLSHALKAFI